MSDDRGCFDVCNGHPEPATTSLTEFLLARFESQRGEAQYVLNLLDGGHRPVMLGSLAGAIESTCRDTIADFEAKRRIVELHQPWPESESCSGCGSTDDWPCSNLRALAAVYAEHPDYDPEWAQ